MSYIKYTTFLQKCNMNIVKFIPIREFFSFVEVESVFACKNFALTIDLNEKN